MRIYVEARDDSDLQAEIYSFLVTMPIGGGTVKVTLESYEKSHRQSRRHRTWTTTAFWSARPSPAAARKMIERPRLPAAIEARIKHELSQRIEYDL